MRNFLTLVMLALCLIALHCTASGTADPGEQLDAPPLTDTASPSVAANLNHGTNPGEGQGEGSQKGPDGGDNGGTAKSGGTGKADKGAEPNPSTVSSASSTGSSSEKGTTVVQSVPDSSTETTTTIKPKTADDDNFEARKNKADVQLSYTGKTSHQLPPSQDLLNKANASSLQTKYSSGIPQQSPQQPSPPTSIKEGDKIQGSTDNVVQQNGHMTTTIKSEPTPQPPLNVNLKNDPAGHSSNKGEDIKNAAAKPIAGEIPPEPPLQGHASTTSNPAKPPVSSPPLQTNGNTNTRQNTGTNIAAPRTNTPPTLPKVNSSVNPPTPTNITNAAAANTMKPSTNSATVHVQDQATPNSEKKEPHQLQTLKTTTSTAAPTDSNETSVTSPTESAKVQSNAPSPPLPKLSTSLQSLDNKDSSIRSVSLFALTTLATLAVMVAVPES